MSRFAKLFAANAIAAAGLCSAAVALSSVAAAEPALPPIMPDVPALGMIQQLASNPAGIGAVLQTAATALIGASSIVGGPTTGSTLPVSPINVPGAAPVAPPAVSTHPIAEYLPLLNQIGIPGNLRANTLGGGGFFRSTYKASAASFRLGSAPQRSSKGAGNMQQG